MLDCSLTADVPLGPFEGVPVTVHSAKNKKAKLHVTSSCTQLRTDNVATAKVPLNAITIGRMCSRCAQWGSWARPASGLGIFLEALGGTGLLYQLHSYTAPDPDDGWEEEELKAAADLLQVEPTAEYGGGDDDDADGQEARDEAEWLRDRVFAHWRDAAKSLHQARAIAAMFPWLEDWVKPKLAMKEQYLESLQAQAALFVDPAGLLLSAAVAGMSEPELSLDDAAFGVLGKREDIAKHVKALWGEWQRRASDGWGRPGDRSYVAYSLVHHIRSNRKGYHQAVAGAESLVASWEDTARTAASSATSAPTRWVIARLPEVSDGDASHSGEAGFLADLDGWTTGVLLTYLVDADWGRRTLTLHVPSLIADRLIADSFLDDCRIHDVGVPPMAAGEASDRTSYIQPGIFDDTPVIDRRPVTADHLRALRTVSPDVDQLYIVFSASSGAEVLPPAVIEKRLARGWNGVIVAGASDLPTSVIESWAGEIGPRPEEHERIWPERVHDVHDPRFGDWLSVTDGARRTAWLTFRYQDGERNLRCLAMARGVHDLRTLDSGSRRRGVPFDVWQGLLTGSPLDLEPFEPPTTDRWRGGSGIPLGVLAEVQVYTTSADPRDEGKGHSPLCGHARERGVTHYDDLLTVGDLLARDDYDWCSKCGGYAARRLTDTQLSYYRAAHRLHDIARQLDPKRAGYDRIDVETLLSRLGELADWRPIGEDHRYAWKARRRWRQIVRGLVDKAEAGRRDTP
ncbi:hypothetical protein [Streptomyces hiroshimensis]|uniref:Uncharacterized protein n=1 Tax=Streptomyces hiroshimensis TaxID=66424 RepID=A0ABQ2Y787_9ACTN|nr:hypothetical protein [Streptomyces hiroshimensis]GGX64704.1 hypothetical protein GCM10010324_07100 [Streptomyces hiroshimensis]